jgi:hypothetical protein
VAGRVSTIHQVTVPPDARALSTLSHIDYEDAFLVDVPARERTAEQWARAVLDDAPLTTRRMLQSGWLSLGLKVGGSGSERVLGWELQRSTQDFVLLAAGSRIGMPAQLLFQCREDTLLFATFVQQDNPLARATWAGVEPVHVRVVRRLLAESFRR